MSEATINVVSNNVKQRVNSFLKMLYQYEAISYRISKTKKNRLKTDAFLLPHAADDVVGWFDELAWFMSTLCQRS
jgi:hypothetical protein